MMKNLFYPLYLIALTGLLASCSTNPAVSTEELADVDFSEFDSFAYLPGIENDTSEYRTIFEDRVVQEVNHQMESRGYHLDPDDPDLLVLVKTMFDQEDRLERRPVARTYNYYTPGFYTTRPLGPVYYTNYNAIPRVSGYSGIQEVEYTEGTFVVDIIDAANRQIIWRGWSQTPVDRENLASSINAYINNIFEEYPLEPGEN